MAQSPSHKFGQIIGNLIESIIKPLLDEYCRKKGFYLDYQANDRPARKGKKVKWTDLYGNSHDLDYVIEKNGTDETPGRPIAFIEVAWRRYTKHSRNKAQEIQGAILPLAETHQWNIPFLGTVLAGIFTEGSITQLKSRGFHVLYFPYEIIIDAFKKVGLDIAFDEKTDDAEFSNCVKILENYSPQIINNVKRYLIKTNNVQIENFLGALEDCLARIVETIVIILLYGNVNEFQSFKQAFSFLDKLIPQNARGNFHKYETIVKFSNGDKIEASFSSKDKLREFLEFMAK